MLGGSAFYVKVINPVHLRDRPCTETLESDLKMQRDIDLGEVLSAPSSWRSQLSRGSDNNCRNTPVGVASRLRLEDRQRRQPVLPNQNTDEPFLTFQFQTMMGKTEPSALSTLECPGPEGSLPSTIAYLEDMSGASFTYNFALFCRVGGCPT